MTSPSNTAFGSRIRRMIDMTVTLLPDPDSPTMPSTSPGAMSNETPSTARTSPSSVRKETRRSRTSSSGASANAHARIEEAVDDVDDRVRDDDEERRVHDGRHDHGQVEVLERVVRQLADAGQPEDHLGEQGSAGHERAEVEPEQADERDHRVAQDVAEHHALLLDALRAGGAHEILVLRVDHARAQYTPVEPDVRNGEREPREDQVLEPERGILRERRVPERWQPREQLVVEAALGDQIDHFAQPEHRHRDAD